MTNSTPINDNPSSDNSSISTSSVIIPPLQLLDLSNIGSSKKSLYFKGKTSEAKRFLEQLEDIFARYNVMTNSNKCKYLIRFCNHQVANVVEGLAAYEKKEWTKLKEEFLKLYDAGISDKKYLKRDLKQFENKHLKKKISSCKSFV